MQEIAIAPGRPQESLVRCGAFGVAQSWRGGYRYWGLGGRVVRIAFAQEPEYPRPLAVVSHSSFACQRFVQALELLVGCLHPRIDPAERSGPPGRHLRTPGMPLCDRKCCIIPRLWPLRGIPYHLGFPTFDAWGLPSHRG